jgi:hypothetical protein
VTSKVQNSLNLESLTLNIERLTLNPYPMDPNYPSPPQPNFNEDDNIDLKRYISLFLSNWYWFAIALFISFTLAYGINRYSEKIYSVSSTLLIKDDELGKMNSNVASVIPGGDIFKSQQNLKNEMGILKSFSLNYRVMKDLEDFHVVYVGVGRRGIVESIMYSKCPLRVVYDSLELEPSGVRVDVTILDAKKYRIKINEGHNINVINSFGERFYKGGFNFTIEWRHPGDSIYLNSNSNSYYFYFTDPGTDRKSVV